METALLTPLDIEAEVQRILHILKGVKDDEYYRVCEMFIGEEKFINVQKSKTEAARASTYNDLLYSETDSSLQEFQIAYCVICRLNDQELLGLEHTINESKARKDGFESYPERFETTRNVAVRMTNILNLVYSDSSIKRLIGFRFQDRSSELLKNARNLNISPETSLEDICYFILFELDKLIIHKTIIPEIEKAERELVNLEN